MTMLAHTGRPSGRPLRAPRSRSLAGAGASGSYLTTIKRFFVSLLVVLTAGRYWAPPGLEKQAADYHEIWIHQLQASMAQLSRHGQQVVVDAHHDMSEAPTAVVTATQQVVYDVRREHE